MFSIELFIESRKWREMRSHSCAIAVLTMLRFCGRKERLLGFTQLSLQVSFTSYLNYVTEISILIPNCVGDLTAGVQVEMLALRISSECHSSTVHGSTD